LTLLGRLLYQAGRVPASIWEMMEEREVGSMMSAHQVAGMAVSMTVRMELGTESRRLESSSLEDKVLEDKVPVPVAWGAARAVAEKRRAARSLNCILMGCEESECGYKTSGRTGKEWSKGKRVTV
jgi:hypothetical protein